MAANGGAGEFLYTASADKAVAKSGYTAASFSATRWTALVPATDFTATPASSSTLTMLVDHTADIPVGSFIRHTIGGNVRYGQVSALTSNLMTVTGTSLSADLTALAWDTQNQGGQFGINAAGPFDTATTPLMDTEARYLVSTFAKSHVVDWCATLGIVDTSAQASIVPVIAGSAAAPVLTLSGTAGTIVHAPVWSGDVAINFGNKIDAQCSNLNSGAGDGAVLSAFLTFVVE